MVKGLAKHGNRLRHGLWAKCVDASLFCDEERLLPNDLLIVAARMCRTIRARLMLGQDG